ncbi:class I mannose-6-phosphate isomerase [Thermosipho ferrireducens]|uniref:Class I mannose-6-phosphate isomerase n=1 Tax=Thermosipho ferrireducens TaxID=2571116 RepID=A0ABX7S5I9_9BACT|nr:type I phosphomannose isomerase catalytic subunit [Thermosipho ferrireducens]QTA37811.1 class I mannose-6-phosphate isomerase [Thermosipho ferrireducens]
MNPAPFFRRMVWGNPEINNIFGLDGEPVGEIWLVSGHPLFTTILEGESINKKSQEILGKKFSRFPLLVKLISTSSWLSVQVHPDDEYAKAVENEPWGKTEAWYFLTDGNIAICEDPSLIPEAISNNTWSKALRIEKIKAGTFVYIPAGTIHALGPNSTVIEVQQSSDLTYRIYDWGRPRETHIDKALEVSKPVRFEDLIKHKISSKYFEMYSVENSDVQGFSITVPKNITKDYSAKIIPVNAKSKVTNSIVIRLGEFFWSL